MAWLKALGVRCPACGAKPHWPCVRIISPHVSLGIENPHGARVEKGIVKWSK